MPRRSEEDEPPGYTGAETTGFVSPAGDHLEGPLDLARVLDLRRPHRYPVRVLGEALVERGILPGDILIADAAAEPRAGAVAIVMLHDEVLVAQLAQRRGSWWCGRGAPIARRCLSPRRSSCGRWSPPWCASGCDRPCRPPTA